MALQLAALCEAGSSRFEARNALHLIQKRKARRLDPVGWRPGTPCISFKKGRQGGNDSYFSVVLQLVALCKAGSSRLEVREAQHLIQERAADNFSLCRLAPEGEW